MQSKPKPLSLVDAADMAFCTNCNCYFNEDDLPDIPEKETEEIIRAFPNCLTDEYLLYADQML